MSYIPSIEQLIFVVEDNGIGLSEEQAAKLFQPFSQGDASHTKKFGGTGLGLSLSRKLAQCLGGDVTLLKTVINSGSVFQVSLAGDPPINAMMLNDLSVFTAQPKEARKETANVNLKGIKVLLAEDSPDNQRLISLFLKKAGADVDVAGDGEEALRMVFENIYHLVLMDIQMPKLNGYESCQLIRQKGYQGKIIALTAHARKEDQDKAFQYGFDDYLSKPIDRAKLLYFVSDYTRTH